VAVGLTDKLLPVVTNIPPQLPLYHFQLPPVPNVPPFTLSVVLWPSQIVDELALALVAGTDVSRTVMVMFLHTVLLQVPSALA
jgi:hypothetical protein